VVLVRNIRIDDKHPLVVLIRRNVQVWGEFSKNSVERHIVVVRCMCQFQDWFYVDGQGLVTPIPQVEAYILLQLKFADKWRAHLRIVEQDLLPDISTRVFLQASHQVGDGIYEQFDGFHTVVDPSGSVVLRLDVDPHGKIIVYYNFVSLCYQIHNITLMMHLGVVTGLPSWVTYIERGSEHRGFVPADHEHKHKLSVASALAFPARRIARDGTTNHVRYVKNHNRTLTLHLSTGGYPQFKHRGYNLSMHRIVAILWGAPNNSGYPMTPDTFHLFEVDHIDGDKDNWDIDNLQWVLGHGNKKLYIALRNSRRL
jgi:hypothetical protein